MQNNDQQFIAQKIRAQYTERTPGKLEELRRLDAEVKRPVNVFAYVFGSIGAIVMGSGMSLIMTELSVLLGVSTLGALLVGVPLGLLGILCICLAYPLYNRTLQKERERVAPQILALTDELLK